MILQICRKVENVSYSIEKKEKINKLSYKIESADVDEIRKEILDNIFMEKEKSGMSNAQLAEISGVSLSYVSRLDRDRYINVTLVTIIRLSMAVDCDIEKLIPDRLLKLHPQSWYGEKFEFLIKDLPDAKKTFILDFVKMYTEKENDEIF